jgi:hypothetical protein
MDAEAEEGMRAMFAGIAMNAIVRNVDVNMLLKSDQHDDAICNAAARLADNMLRVLETRPAR